MFGRYLHAAFALLLLTGPASADYIGGLDPNGDNYVSLRSGPGSKYDELRQLAPDTVVTVIEERGRWRRVRLEDGSEGWAFGKYVLPGLPAALDAPSEAPAEQPLATEEFPPDEDIGGAIEPLPSKGRGEETAPGDSEGQQLSSPETVDVDGIVGDILLGLHGLK